MFVLVPMSCLCIKCKAKQIEFFHPGQERLGRIVCVEAIVYATCFATDDGETLTKLSKVFASSCKSGSTVVTVNKRLKEEDGFTMITTLQGHNPDSASFDATAFIWRAP